MKVLALAHSISDVRGGGEAIGAWELVRHLAEAGVETHAIAAGLEVRAPLPTGLRIDEAPGGERDRWGNSGRNKAALVAAARRALARERFDLVHVVTQFTSFPILARPFAISGCVTRPAIPSLARGGSSRLARLRTDVSRYGARSVVGDVAFALRWERARGWTRERTLSEADAVVVRQSLGREALAGRARRLEFIPFGVNPGPARGERARERRFVFAGRLDFDKGTDVALDALARVPEATLDVFGEGQERGRLEAQVRRLGLAERVRFRGHAAREIVAEAFATALAGILPSRGESFGQVNLEAMSAGTPVITTPEVAGAPDYLAEGESGFFVPADDPAALARAMQRLLDDPRLSDRLGANARKSAERFDWREIARRHVALYASLP